MTTSCEITTTNPVYGENWDGKNLPFVYIAFLSAQPDHWFPKQTDHRLPKLLDLPIPWKKKRSHNKPTVSDTG